jgi:hypothetical protein
MAAADAFAEARRRISRALLTETAVAEVRLAPAGVVIYLLRDGPSLRERLTRRAGSVAPGVAVAFSGSGLPRDPSALLA